MSLRELARFDVTNNTGDPLFWGVTIGVGMRQSVTSGLAVFLWIPRTGLLASVEHDRVIMTLDGVYEKCGDQVLGYTGWDVGAGRLLVMGATGYEWLYDQRMILKTAVQFTPMGVEPLSGHPFSWANTYVKTQDSTYYWYAPGVGVVKARFGDTAYTVVHDAFDDTTDENIFDAAFGSQVWAGRGDGEIFISSFNDPVACLFFSVQSNEISSRIMYLPADVTKITYSPEWGVILAVIEPESDQEVIPYQLVIYSLVTWPVELTEPELVSGAVQQGAVATFEVRALGDVGDACEGEKVNWSITGSGTLLDTQSVTDEDGYATARVRFGVTETALFTITATLKC